MTIKNIEDKVGGSLWRLVISICGVAGTLISGIFWLSNVDHTAQEALARSRENAAKLQVLSEDVQSMKLALTEMRVDMRYLINSVDEVKARMPKTQSK